MMATLVKVRVTNIYDIKENNTFDYLARMFLKRLLLNNFATARKYPFLHRRSHV